MPKDWIGKRSLLGFDSQQDNAPAERIKEMSALRQVLQSQLKA